MQLRGPLMCEWWQRQVGRSRRPVVVETIIGRAMIGVLVESVIAVVVVVVEVDGGRWSNKRGVDQLFDGAGRVISRWRRGSGGRIGWGLGLSILEEGHDLYQARVRALQVHEPGRM